MNIVGYRDEAFFWNPACLDEGEVRSLYGKGCM